MFTLGIWKYRKAGRKVLILHNPITKKPPLLKWWYVSFQFSLSPRNSYRGQQSRQHRSTFYWILHDPNNDIDNFKEISKNLFLKISISEIVAKSFSRVLNFGRKIGEEKHINPYAQHSHNPVHSQRQNFFLEDIRS